MAKKKQKEHEYITQAEFARRMGVNRKQVTLAVQKSRIELSDVTDSRGVRLIDWDEQKDNWDANRRDQTRFSRPRTTEVADKIGDIPDVSDEVSGRTPQNPREFSSAEKIEGRPGTYQYEATRKTYFDAERNKLKFLQEIQALLPFDSAISIFYEILIGTRDGIMAMAARNTGTLSAKIKGLVKEWKPGGEEMIDTLISNAFTEAGKTVLSEIEVNMNKDFRQVAKAKEDARRKKK